MADVNGEPTPPLSSIWLDAFNDPGADITACTACVHACNLFGDGDNRLVIAESDRKLKVWKGTQKASELPILGSPVAICSFIPDSDDTDQPRLPILAVATGSNIFMYRNMRSFARFTLPPEAPGTEEQGTGHVDGRRVQQTRGPFVTCLDVVKQALDEPDAVSCLVVGTESSRVLILDSAGTSIVKNIWVGIVPTMIAVQGELDVWYHITVVGRDGKLYFIHNGELAETIIQLESQPVGLVRLAKHVVVGCSNGAIHGYLPNGEKSWSVYVPGDILAMQRMEVTGQRMTKALVVALSNGEVRVYNEKLLVSLHTVPNPVTALWFGRYGREDNTLLTITKSGMLDIKTLSSTASLEAGPEEDAPLPPDPSELTADLELLHGEETHVC